VRGEVLQMGRKQDRIRTTKLSRGTFFEGSIYTPLRLYRARGSRRSRQLRRAPRGLRGTRPLCLLVPRVQQPSQEPVTAQLLRKRARPGDQIRLETRRQCLPETATCLGQWRRTLPSRQRSYMPQPREVGPAERYPRCVLRQF